ncbi:MAG: glucosaminidase domain-containing protein [Candidatus Saccharibacteria bacterium]|nr:glucosaminidase domain-containing protein [Candidatus Saccharibacteria bacterium]
MVSLRLKKDFHLRLLAWLFVILAGTMAITPVSALSEEDLDRFAQNNILFYDPSATDCTVAVGSYDGEASSGLTATQAGFVDQYHDIAANLSVQYGIPWETVMAQGILESAAGTSRFATERNNFFGIGAFDSNPDNAFRYDTPTDGWRGYYQNIAKTATYRNHGVFQGDAITDPYVYLAAIKAAGYATDPAYIEKNSKLIAAVENRAQEKGWMSSAQLAVAYPEMIANAAKYAAGKDVDVDTSGIVTSCVAGGGNGDINQTAIDLAWKKDEAGYRDKEPNDSYRAALKAVGLTEYGNAQVKRGSSCDAFATTVYRYSGVDPDFYCCKTSQQLEWLKNNDDYIHISPNTTDTSVLAPGDIMILAGHIKLYVEIDGVGYEAQASHDEYSGRLSKGVSLTDTIGRGTYQIFRHK